MMKKLILSSLLCLWLNLIPIAITWMGANSFLSLISRFTTGALSAQVKELEDVEIIGASALSTSLSKKPLVKAILPVLAKSDSLPLQLPDYDVERDANPAERGNPYKHFYGFAGINSRSSYRQHLIMSYPQNNFSSGWLQNSCLSPHQNWKHYQGNASLTYTEKWFSLSGGAGYQKIQTPLATDEFLARSFSLDLQRLKTALSSKFDLELQAEFDQCYLGNHLNENSNSQNKWNNALILRDYTTPYANLNLSLHSIDNSELAYLNIANNPFADFQWRAPLRSFVLFATPDHLLPSLELSWQRNLTPQSSFSFTQKPVYETRSLYASYARMPWQNSANPAANTSRQSGKYSLAEAYNKIHLASRHPVSLTPLNFNAAIVTRDRISATEQLSFRAEMGASYTLDQPVMESANLTELTGGFYLSDNFPLKGKVASDLPVLVSHRCLQTIAGISVTSAYPSLTISQQLKLQKTWLADDNYHPLAYQPLYAFITELSYHKAPHLLSGSLEQGFQTRDEQGELLRPALELDFTYKYQLSDTSQLFFLYDNALNQGRIIHTAIPSDPSALQVGISYLF